MNCSIIIPNYNGANFLKDCLPSLFTSITNCPSSKFEVIVVDNGSTDESLKLLSQYKTIRVIKLKQNTGFAFAVNQGIDTAIYEYVCLLNNDLILDKLWFRKINQQINSKNKYAVYCGTVLTRDGTKYESVGFSFDYRGKCQNINNGQLYLQSKIHDLTPSRIWGSSAALVIYNKNILNKVGGFDNDFFAYEEDVDVALRLHLLGYKTLFIPTAISYHLGGGTSSKMNNFRNIMDTKNWFYIIIKDYPISTIIINLPQILIERLRNLSGLIKATPIRKLPSSLIKSYGQVLIYLPRMLVKRRQFQKLLKTKL